MARPRSPNREKAFKMYKKYKGKITLSQIADTFGEKVKTVSKWKCLDKWDDKLNSIGLGNKNKSKNSILCGVGEKDSTNEKQCSNDNYMILQEICDIEDMTERDALFCIYYVKYFNATKAYQKAFGCASSTAKVNGSKKLSKANIQIAISKLKQNKLNRALLSEDDIFQKYMDIAFADISDFISFGRKDVIVEIDENGDPVYQTINYIDFHDCDNVDGTLIHEVKKGKDGISVKLEDRMKALDWIANHMDLATEEQRARVESLRNKVKVENETLKLKKKEFERNNW